MRRHAAQPRHQLGFVQDVAADSLVAACPFERLQVMKEAIYCACDLAKEYAQEDAIPKSSEEKLYWAVFLWRGGRAAQGHLVAKAVKADLALKEVVDSSSGRVVDLPWLQNHIKELQNDLHQKWMSEAASVPVEANSSAGQLEVQGYAKDDAEEEALGKRCQSHLLARHSWRAWRVSCW